MAARYHRAWRPVYSESEEEQALQRWYNYEFLDIERQIAKKWRQQLSNVDHSEGSLPAETVIVALDMYLRPPPSDAYDGLVW
jgi:hypothetical protein